MYEKSIWNKLPDYDKPIVIYGTGDGCEKLLDICEKKNIKISGIFASDEFCRNREFHGFKVKTYNEIKNQFPDMVVLLAFAAFRDDLIEKIKSIAKETEFYAPSLPMFESELFDKSYYIRNFDKINKTRDILYDDESRKVFDDIICFRLSGKIEYLFDAEDDSTTFNSLIPYSENDIYLDLGAYNGDTALEFDKFRNSKYDKMILVEPNVKILKKLIDNTNDLRCEIKNNAAWNKNEVLFFNGKTGRSASLDRNGKVEVEAISPDDLTEKATVIKYDVEGAEKEAIEGSKRLITECSPTLIVSAYHKTEDLFSIPEQILEMQNYKVFLRHKKYIPDWDTLYYFVK